MANLNKIDVALLSQTSVFLLMLRAKKSLGQHFLNDDNIAMRIVDAFIADNTSHEVIEVGPGKGVLTRFLLQQNTISLNVIELDHRMLPILVHRFPQLKGKIFNEDILQFELSRISNGQLSIIGNFPYNISSQILFRIFENREIVQCMVGMFQKEVAKRITASHGNKEYGILSVFIQAFYDSKYLFDVEEKSFDPPPRVKSGVISLVRKMKSPLIIDIGKFRQLVKSGFEQRRKILRNSLHQHINHSVSADELLFDKRAEQLSVSEWIDLSNRLAVI